MLNSKYVLSTVLSCYSKPSPDAMTEYNKKVEFLKGLIETQKMVRQGSMS